MPEKRKMEETYDICLREMFRLVGEPWPPGDGMKGDPEWYRRRGWTERQERDFARWMKRTLRERHGWPKHKCDLETGMFILDVGWTTRDRNDNKKE